MLFSRSNGFQIARRSVLPRHERQEQPGQARAKVRPIARRDLVAVWLPGLPLPGKKCPNWRRNVVAQSTTRHSGLVFLWRLKFRLRQPPRLLPRTNSRGQSVWYQLALIEHGPAEPDWQLPAIKRRQFEGAKSSEETYPDSVEFPDSKGIAALRRSGKMAHASSPKEGLEPR